MTCPNCHCKVIGNYDTCQYCGSDLRYSTDIYFEDFKSVPAPHEWENNYEQIEEQEEQEENTLQQRDCWRELRRGNQLKRQIILFQGAILAIAILQLLVLVIILLV